MNAPIQGTQDTDKLDDKIKKTFFLTRQELKDQMFLTLAHLTNAAPSECKLTVQAPRFDVKTWVISMSFNANVSIFNSEERLHRFSISVLLNEMDLFLTNKSPGELLDAKFEMQCMKFRHTYMRNN